MRKGIFTPSQINTIRIRPVPSKKEKGGQLLPVFLPHQPGNFN
jgi:hypothetical protein